MVRSSSAVAEAAAAVQRGAERARPVGVASPALYSPERPPLNRIGGGMAHRARALPNDFLVTDRKSKKFETSAAFRPRSRRR
eukprot:7377822-Prymnesium_polylepis.2